MTSQRNGLVAAGLSLALFGVLWQFGPTPTREIRVVHEGRPTAAVQRELETAYGKSRYSMGPEELILREIFNDQRDGIFIDVGAADARALSNTYYLESELGWSGVAIDPQVSFAADYARYRPATRFRPFFISDVSDEHIPFYVQAGRYGSSSSRAWAAGAGGALTEISVATITLDDLLDREGIARFDLLAIDIELHEPAALAGFTIDRFRPRVICIEAQGSVRQQILTYFARHGYVILGRYLDVDPFNLYFVPLPTAA